MEAVDTTSRLEFEAAYSARAQIRVKKFPLGAHLGQQWHTVQPRCLRWYEHSAVITRQVGEPRRWFNAVDLHVADGSSLCRMWRWWPGPPRSRKKITSSASGSSAWWGPPRG